MLADSVRRRLGAGLAVGDDVVAEAAAFLAGPGVDAGRWRARHRPAGTPLLSGHPARGTVLELTGPDRPLVVTSVEEELRGRRAPLAQITPLTVGVRRAPDGAMVAVGPARGAAVAEALLQVELQEVIGDDRARDLCDDLLLVLDRIEVVAGDHDAMRDRLRGLAARLTAASDDREEVRAATATLSWLLDGNALLLGLARRPAGTALGTPPPGPPDLGLYRVPEPRGVAPDGDEPSDVGPDRPVRVHRIARPSPLHRRVPMLRMDLWAPDDRDGPPIVEHLLWVVSRRAAGTPVAAVPLLRRKLDRLLEREDVVPGSYDEQHLTLLFQSLPEDDLFSLDVDALHLLVRELRVEDRDHSVRVVMRPVPEAHAVATLVTVPVERWTRALRGRLERFLLAQLDGQAVDVALSIGGGSSAVTARFLVHVRPEEQLPATLDAVTREVRLLCRSWEEQLGAALVEHLAVAIDDAGPDGGALPAGGPEEDPAATAAWWGSRLPEAYRDVVPPAEAVGDVLELEALRTAVAAGPGPHQRVWFGSRRTSSGPERLGLVTDHAVELSRLLPALESLDLWVTDEARWAVGDLHLHHLGVRVRPHPEADGPPPDLAGSDAGARLAQAVEVLLAGRAERDGLNRLVLHAGLGWSEVAVLRAYRRYRHQVDTRHDEAYVDEVLVGHPRVARLLVDLWHARAGAPATGGHPSEPDGARREQVAVAARAVHEACDALERLDHDRVLRGLAGTIEATLRTNTHLRPEGPLALKLDPALVPDAPDPRPHREIFVSGRTVEGVHLRAGPVARGGLRASDRDQDYRAEVLDLMRTQVLKNAVIVPTGAKGGFVVRPEADEGPERPRPDRRALVAEAYDAFVGALLDVTDDVDARGRVVPVPGRWDGDDPYLVVAADKGTATFSDRANALALDRGFWLGDAFASGGSQGYDHKALGITARGAWVAIARHLRSLGLDPTRDDITVAGVGDMSGDVFGNGMLLAPRLRLVAAFDHRHVFLDPDPDVDAALAERRRLFARPRSSWDDYDRSLLSEGGGVHPRTAKAVPVGPAVAEALRTDEGEVTPAELIRAVLRAPVDLLYFGGIGTYVRASTEDDARVDDRANAELRVVGRELRARVVGEGANLALTQRARIEVARRGGRINVDAIDNAAGVDCSDHEVNIKVLLAAAEAEGRIDRAERDALLVEVTGDVVASVLGDCASQSDALDRAERATPEEVATLGLVLRRLVAEGVLDPEVEALPDDREVEARVAAGAGFARPELAVLLAGVKRRTAGELLASGVPDAPVTRDALVGYFPPVLAERFDDLLDGHRLRRELVASEVANDLVDHLGLTAVVSLADEVGVGVAEVALAYWVARAVLRAPERWEQLGAHRRAMAPDLHPDPLDGADVLADALQSVTRAELVRRRRARRAGGPWDPVARIAADRPVADAVAAHLADGVDDDHRRARSRLATRLVAAGLAPEVAEEAADVADLEVVPDVATVARDLDRDPVEVLRAFRAATRRLGLDDLTRRARALEPEGPWAAAARQGILDDLLGIRRETARRALAAVPGGVDPVEAVGRHLASDEVAVADADAVRRRVASEDGADLDALAVAVRAIRRAAL